MKIAAIIVNYRTPDMTAQSASKLLAELPAGAESHLYVVDNDSGDGSLEQLRSAARTRGWGTRVSVLSAPRNGGYGYGINLAVAQALARSDRPEYIYLINSDAYPDRGSLARMVAFMDGHPKAGIAGSLVHSPDGTLQAAAFRFPTLWSEFEHSAGFGVLSRALRRYIVSLPPPDHNRTVDWVPGTSMLVRREVFEQGGMFDEDFFLYFEEVDFCHRARLNGFRCFYVANAPITHIGSVSTGMLDENRPTPRYWFDSRHRYFLKHHGRAYTAASDAAWVVGYVIARVKCKLQGRKPHHSTQMLRGVLLSGLRDLLKPRLPAARYAKVTPKSDGARTAGKALHDTRNADDIGLLELLAEDFATHDRDPLEPGLWAIVAHRLGRRAPELPSPYARVALDGSYQLLSLTTDWIFGIHLPRSVQVGRRVRIWHNGCMVLAAHSIGDDVHIRHDTTFGPAPRSAQNGSDGLPAIEDRADIGSGVCVLGPVTIGHDAMVGANSVVLKDIPPHATVLGVPARIIPA